MHSRSVSRIALSLFVLVIAAVGSVDAQKPRPRPAPAESPRAATRPQLVAQLGHSSTIYAVAFSPAGDYLVSVGDDGAVVWTAAGQELRHFANLGASVSTGAVSHDARVVLTTGKEGTHLWDVRTGAEIRRLDLGDEADSVAFTPDDQHVVVGYWGKIQVKEWDLGSGQLVRTLENASSPVAVSRDGRRVLVCWALESTAKLLDAATGAVVAEFKGHGESVNTVAISPDGAIVATGSGHYTTYADNTVRAWDAATGKEKWRKDCGAPVKGVAFSSDGRSLVVACDDKTARLINAANGEELARFTGHTQEVTAAALSADGNVVATASYSEVRLWDAATGKEMHRLDAAARSVKSVAFSPDSRHLLTGSDAIRLWDLATGLQVWPGDRIDWADVASFSPDGKYVLVRGESLEHADLRDPATGKTLEQYGKACVIFDAEVSPDSKYVLVGCREGTAALLERDTARPVRLFESDKVPVNDVAFSPDGKLVLVSKAIDEKGNFDPKTHVFDATTGAEVTTLAGDRPVSFSPDGELILTVENNAITSTTSTLSLWNRATGQPVRRIMTESGHISSAAFTPDGKEILTGGVDRRVHLWDVASGRELRVFVGHSGWVDSVAASPDGRLVVSGSNDATIRFWDRGTGKELCQLLTMPNDVWVVVAPDGRFDTNDPDNIVGLHWLFADDPMRVLPIEIFMRQYYEPRLLARVLAGERLPDVPDISTLDRAQPEVRISAIDPLPDAPDRVRVRLDVAAPHAVQKPGARKGGSGVYDVRLFREGQLVGYAPERDGAVDLGSRGTATLTFDVRLPRRSDDKEVEFSAYAFNEDRVKSATERRIYTLGQPLASERGRVYLIGVGINAYDDPSLTLKFAANDARRTQESLKERLSTSYRFKGVVPVLLVSEQNGPALATKANIKAVLDVLAGRAVDPSVLASIPGADQLQPATPNDVVIISFASHGYSDGRGNFYLVPSDVGANARKQIAAAGKGRSLELSAPDSGAARDVLSRCISSDELGLWLRDVDAGEMAMIIDACQSAAFTGESFKPGPMGSRGLGQLAYDKRMRILAATQADNVALESNRLEHGLLTYALVPEGLEQWLADFAPADGEILLPEWLSYAVDRVPRLVEEIGSGKTRQLVLDGDAAPPPVEKLQRPALFDFARKRREIVLASREP